MHILVHGVSEFDDREVIFKNDGYSAHNSLAIMVYLDHVRADHQIGRGRPISLPARFLELTLININI